MAGTWARRPLPPLAWQYYPNFLYYLLGVPCHWPWVGIMRQAARVIFNLPWHKSHKTVTVTKSKEQQPDLLLELLPGLGTNYVGAHTLRRVSKVNGEPKSSSRRRRPTTSSPTRAKQNFKTKQSNAAGGNFASVSVSLSVSLAACSSFLPGCHSGWH